MFLFKSKEEKASKLLLKKLTKYLLNSDLMAKLILQARKDMEFEQLTLSPLSFPIIKDLINSAANGVTIEATLKDNTKIVIKPDNDTNPEYQEKLKAIQREAQKEYY